MMTDSKKMKVEFAPGAFDSFEGTQEELDELIAEIQRMVESGEFLEKGTPIDIDQLIEDDPEMAEKLMRSFDDEENPRPLQ
jgi:hypothetical protein